MSARNVAVVGFAHAPHVRRTDGTTNGVEMLMPCFAKLYDELGITKADIGFWCSGSSDFLAGRAFSFISAIDSIGAVPPINESHVEMDAAWAAYEAYIKLLTGEVDTALVYGFGKSSAGILRRILSRQTDPTRWRRCGRIPCRSPRCRPASDSRPKSGVLNRWPASPTTRSRWPSGWTGCRRPRVLRTCCSDRFSRTRCGATTSHQSPTAPPRSYSPPTTALASCAKTLPGSPVSSTASNPGAGRTRSHGVAVDHRSDEDRHRRQNAHHRRRRDPCPVHPPTSHPRGGHAAAGIGQSESVRRRPGSEPDVRRRP
ncbi:putative lipid transfer protein/keto acyl-CoA thiolase Ltp4 [Mycobacterium xenopi 4042]|uniref:Putative lipid transfer protein/keto acyl-CoA thiolase Ltp4 n=1 Tax=Mycobacterium xenopi 4042 TaxID=1299334 RepID=X7ZYT1_MYCXE|nr:putative lipid transfer protein/keto acyl-CoA thiolase Ltp4 [Mycobacterium xenopi 4042]